MLLRVGQLGSVGAGGRRAPTVQPPPEPATAPVLTKTSSSGINPMTWTSDYSDLVADSDYIGMRWRLDGGAWTVEADHLFTSGDFLDSEDGSLVIPWPLYNAAAPFAPNSVLDVEESVLRNSVRTYSNRLTDTMAVISETATHLVATNGAGKSQYTTVSGGDLTAAGQGGFNNAPISVRATQSRTGKRQFQTTIIYPSSNPIWVGIDDGATNFNAGFAIPGKDNSAGVALRLTPGQFSIYVGGALAQDVSATNAGAQDGDQIFATFDTAGGTASFYRRRSGTVSQFGAPQALSLTSFYAFVAFEDASSQTIKFGSGQDRTLDNGYTPYDQ